MCNLIPRFLLLAIALMMISCDSPKHVPDDSQVKDLETAVDRPASEDLNVDRSASDVTPSDLPARDTSPGDTATPDVAQGTGEYATACCVPGATNCQHAQCKPGLVCLVFPGGPYVEQGVCTQKCDNTPCPELPDSNSAVCFQDHCAYPCPPPPSGCDSSSCYGCPTGLNCRILVSQGFCMP